MLWALFSVQDEDLKATNSKIDVLILDILQGKYGLPHHSLF